VIIYLIRHARPHRVESICYGRRDVAVEASETKCAARAARQQIPEGIIESAPFYSSPLERCAMLAREIADGRSVTLTPALLELDFGAWQGRCWDAIPRAELDAWAADLWRYAPGRGESAEAAAVRWRSWVDSLHRQPSEAVIAVTHAGLIRVAHAVASACDPTLLTMEVGYGSVYPIDVPTPRVSTAALEHADP
jgi:alpha-ribazole phosphatase